MKYDFNKIEDKWQKYWAEKQTFKARNPNSPSAGGGRGEAGPPFYVLDMFPYPSGAGLHVGHPLGYIASDIYARYKRHKGFNVLHPQGYDSFGLPAEQYAIQTGQHPVITTKQNIARYREQLDKLGFSFDWSREVRTSDPQYYKWTQWIFIQLFESWYDNKTNKARPIQELKEIFSSEGNSLVKAACDADAEEFSAKDWNSFSSEEKQRQLLKYRLTYLAETEVNWVPQLGTVLANDEIVNGVSERGGFPVIRKKMTQWSMRVSAYAERLLQGLEKIDCAESLKETQRNWIGKSVGAEVQFKIKAHPQPFPEGKERVHSKEGLKERKVLPSGEDIEGARISVFTTRPDTIFGVTFMTLAPEHELVEKITTPRQKDAVEAYIAQTAKRSERERMADIKTISGVFTGAYAEHPFTKEPIPVWIGDYVLAGYGTGAVMAVPCGDQRDYDFAKHFNLPIKNIFKDIDISEGAYSGKDENTIITNSGFLEGLSYKEALEKAIAELEKAGQGKRKINYRLRDAVFSRQRYWGEPFPIYYKDGMPQTLPEECLPLKLPEVEKYLPTETGEPPLGNARNWYWNTKTKEVVSPPLEESGETFPLELNTMPGWAGSSWYFFRYMDAHNEKEFVSPEAQEYWQNVDLYVGGSEHATGHLLYSRFWTKFLKDRGLITVEEPFKKLINQGMILGQSAFVYRVEGENTFVSKNLIEEKPVQPIHVDVSLINFSDELDIEAFKKWRSEYKDAVFILDNGEAYNSNFSSFGEGEAEAFSSPSGRLGGAFIVGREVEKMSKSKYNVVNPDDICENYGADTLRMYEMFLGPLEQAKPWNTAGITGVHNFLKKLWKLYHQAPSNSPKGGEQDFFVSEENASGDSLRILHKTIKKVTDDIENFSFNTSVSTFMICVNELSAEKCHQREVLEPLIILIAPYAPHIAEEIWQKLGHENSISTAAYPKYEEKYLTESTKVYPVSFNGKMKFTLELSLELQKEKIQEAVMQQEKTRQILEGKMPKKVIIVPGKIVNIVY